MLQVRLGDIIADVYEIVDIDTDDQRVYLRTFKGGEVFCVTPWNVYVVQPEPSTVMDSVAVAYGVSELESDAGKIKDGVSSPLWFANQPEVHPNGEDL